jgi:hypothetical protein
MTMVIIIIIQKFRFPRIFRIPNFNFGKDSLCINLTIQRKQRPFTMLV